MKFADGIRNNVCRPFINTKKNSYGSLGYRPIPIDGAPNDINPELIAPNS